MYYTIAIVLYITFCNCRDFYNRTVSTKDRHLENIMGRTLHERVPLKGKHAFAASTSTWTWMAIAFAGVVFAAAIHALK